MKALLNLCRAGLLSAMWLCAQQVSTQPTASLPTDFDRLVETKNYPALEQGLPAAASLDRASQIYFLGILADRLAKFSQAQEQLREVLPALRSTNPHRTAIALLALSQDDFMLGNYRAAREDLQELNDHFLAELLQADQKNVRDNLGILTLISSYPRQTVSGGLSFSLPVQHDLIGDLDIPVQSNRSQAWWIFDTGANITTISRTTANRLGLKVSEQNAQTQSGATGLEIPLSTALIPELKVGTAVIHNVVALVLSDRDLAIDLGKGKHFQMEGILGYPALYALGTFTVSGEQMMKIAPYKGVTAESARLYVEQLTPMVSAGFQGQQLLFQFDTGNNGAELTATFKRRFKSFFSILEEKNARFAGAGQVATLPMVSVPKLKLTLGKCTAQLENITLVGQDRGLAPLDVLYGNLGQALLSQFHAYTINLKAMTFTPETPADTP